VQELKPNDALTMYMDACRLLEDDNREQMAFDTYRAASNLYIKLNKYLIIQFSPLFFWCLFL